MSIEINVILETERELVALEINTYLNRTYKARLQIIMVPEMKKDYIPLIWLLLVTESLI